MINIPVEFTAQSLYIAGFAQARAPHQALMIASDAKTGTIVHIRIDRGTAPTWAYQSRVQKIEGDMFLSTLLKIHDISAGEITVDQLQQAASAVLVPDNDEFGECGPWVYRVVERLREMCLVKLEDSGELQKEFSEFAAGNRAFARRDRFPNVAVSKFWEDTTPWDSLKDSLKDHYQDFDDILSTRIPISKDNQRALRLMHECAADAPDFTAQQTDNEAW